MLKETFNAEVNVDPRRDPIHMGVNAEGLIMVHETNWFGITNDVEYYTPEEFADKYGDEDLKTYDDMVNEYKSLMDDRYVALGKACDHLKDKFNNDLGSFANTTEDMNRMQRRVIESVTSISNNSVIISEELERAQELSGAAHEIGIDMRTIRERFSDIEEDLKEHERPVPEVVSELKSGF